MNAPLPGRIARGSLAVLLALAALVVPAGATAGDGLARLQVVESLGTAAVMGVITRVPAESPGGGAYTETHITTAKALGRAAGAYPGPLGEAFLGTSTELYQNPSMVVAQQPPGLFPAEAQVEGGQHGSQGTVGLIRAKAASRSEVEAEVVMGAGPPDAPFVVEGGVSRSRSRVEPDGTVVTEVETTFGRAVAGEVLEMVGGASRAVAVAPPRGEPTLELESTLGEMTLNGVGARLSDDGLVMADIQLASPAEIAAFNAGLAELRQAGITLEAVPAQRQTEDGGGRISGAAGLFRYQLPSNPIPNSIGNDEAFLVAQVSAAAVAVPRAEEAVAEAPPPLDLPGLGSGPEAAPSAPAFAPPGGEPAAAPPAPLPPPAASAFDLPAFGPPAGFSATPAASSPVAASPAAAADGAVAGSDRGEGAFPEGRRLALPASARRSLVASVTGFYAVLVFLGAGAVLILLGLHRARTT